MGATILKVLSFFCQRKDMRLVILGLGAVGKTSIFYRLQHKQFISTNPTVGFNVETIKLNNLNLLIWDIGASLIPLWKYYITYTQGLIFVIDSSDTEGIIKAKHEFQYILANEDVRKSAILILANKSDIAKMKIEDITQILELHKLKQKWHVQSTCALTGEGISQGMQWLTREIDYK